MARLTSDQLADVLVDADRDGIRSLVDSQVIAPEPHAFTSDMSVYGRVRDHLGSKLRCTSDNIVIVGSGKTGYSLTPNAFPKAFHEGSDLDFAVVSPRLFDEAWGAMRRWAYPRRHDLPRPENDWLLSRENEVFWGWLSPDYLRFTGLRFPQELRPLRDLSVRWLDTFNGLAAAFPGTEVATRDSGARLYRSKDHLRDYQADGLRQLQQRLRKAKGGT